MTLSVEGALVFFALLLLGRLAGGTIIIALFASIAFGATALVAIPALGNSSPLIYSLLVLCLIASASLHPSFFKGLGLVFQQGPTATIACVLAFYALSSAIILPRLFAGDVNVFIPVEGTIIEVALTPSGGNITQTAYLIAGIAAFLCLRVLLLDRSYIKAAQRALFAFVIADLFLGVIDLAGKIAGLGDVLAPIRTANFALLAEDEVGGFARIVGGHSEASAFAVSALACVSFSFVYWRLTGSKLAFILTAVSFLLLVFSTSSTGYAGLTLLGAICMLKLPSIISLQNFKSRDLLLLLIVLVFCGIVTGMYLWDEHVYEPLADVIDAMAFRKAESGSGQERLYWNEVGLNTFFDTYGLGIGMGSSRSSSWPVSAMAQLGALGALLFCLLLAGIVRDGGAKPVRSEGDVHALASSAKAMAIGWICGVSLVGGSADPGLLVFLLLAVILGCEYHLKASWVSRYQLTRVRPAVIYPASILPGRNPDFLNGVSS